MERLAGSVRLRALVRRTSDVSRLRELGIELAEGSLDRPETLRDAVGGVDVVLHLAALTHARNPGEFLRVNAEGTRSLVYAALEANPGPLRFVYLSSLAAVGPSYGGRPVGPETPPRPLTSYGRSKLAGEDALRGAEDKRLETTILRAPAVYGPRDRELHRVFRLAALGLLAVPAGPARYLQLVHVGDLADAIVRAALAPSASGLLHIAHPVAHEWTEMNRLVAEAVGRKARTFRVPRPVLAAAATLSEGASRLAGRTTVFNREKVRELLAPGWLCETDTARLALGFEARIPLPQGLRETAEWYRENGWL